MFLIKFSTNLIFFLHIYCFYQKNVIKLSKKKPKTTFNYEEINIKCLGSCSFFFLCGRKRTGKTERLCESQGNR